MQPPSRNLSRRNLLRGAVSSAFSLASVGAFAGLFRAPKGPTWNPAFELAIDLEINAVKGGRRYHRPYVAIWIEDHNGKPVRTVSVWYQIERRGTRWLPDLRRWFRGDNRRQEAGGKPVISTVSSATRNPGKHTVTWDGKDDNGKYVPLGDYAVCIEAAREHGTYQLIRKAYRFTAKPFSDRIMGNLEIKDANVAYGKRG